MCELPKHFTLELVEKALIKAFGDKTAKVLSLETNLAVASGDNFTSDVFQVFVCYQVEGSPPKQISLIVKFILETESIVELLTDYKFFVKEKEIYLNILPKIAKLFNEEFTPKCYHIMEEPSKIFFMEDLKAPGYIVLDRQAGLDLEHCTLVLKKLAKFHAASMILAEKEPKTMEIFNFGFIKKQASSEGALPPHFLGGLGTLIDEASTWPDFKNIVEKLKNIEENFDERVYKFIEQKSSFKVLNHGDLWTNNFMIKYDQKKTPAKVLFIDHQIGFYSSMGIDWHYFMTLSPTNAVKTQHMGLLLETYYTSLVDTLKHLKYSKIPTFKNVQDEVANYEFYAFLACLGPLPTVLMDRDSGVVTNMESIQDEEASKEVRRVQFRGKIFQETVKIILKRLDSIKVLD